MVLQGEMVGRTRDKQALILWPHARLTRFPLTLNPQDHTERLAL